MTTVWHFIILRNSLQKRQVPLPNQITRISRVFSLNILGVTINSQLSVSEHISSVIGSSTNHTRPQNSAFTRHVHWGTSACLQIIVAKFLYTASAWWGLTSAADCQWLQNCQMRHPFRIVQPRQPNSGRIGWLCWWNTFQTCCNKPKPCTVSVASSVIH